MFRIIFLPNALQIQENVVTLHCLREGHRQRLAIIAQLVEHWLPKPRVAGSSPVYRSCVDLKACIDSTMAR